MLDINNTCVHHMLPFYYPLITYMQLNLSSDSIRWFKSSSPSSPPSLFLCLLLTGYKTQVTPVECSFNPTFQFTANYVINMDEGFLQQLNTVCTVHVILSERWPSRGRPANKCTYMYIILVHFMLCTLYIVDSIHVHVQCMCIQK